jgi:hypothetical protein
MVFMATTAGAGAEAAGAAAGVGAGAGAALSLIGYCGDAIAHALNAETIKAAAAAR